MNGSNILLDTNIILYLLSGDESLIPLLEEKNLFLSFISQLELLGSRYLNHEDTVKIRSFISAPLSAHLSPSFFHHGVHGVELS